uniref:Transposase n=1 Tax=Schistosoma curassoni TaxID=6186 RepID=A0A183JKV6_9TREM
MSLLYICIADNWDSDRIANLQTYIPTTLRNATGFEYTQCSDCIAKIISPFS